MLYDIRLQLDYTYEAPVTGGRHLVRIVPVSLTNIQRVIATALHVEPNPSEHTEFTDFFGSRVAALAFRAAHDVLEITMNARIDVVRTVPKDPPSPPIPELIEQIAASWDMSARSPHHYLGPSPRIVITPDITDYARASAPEHAPVFEIANTMCTRIHADFAYDGEATLVDTPVTEAFEMRRGVCQDFAHIMISGLRGLGIPAGYVSGFLRTLPPEGQPRLEGADAMHAWVKVWCGQETGWVEFDPTNAMLAGPDHIVIGYGRDYSDATPIVGVLRSAGGQETSQAVDVVAVR